MNTIIWILDCLQVSVEPETELSDMDLLHSYMPFSSSDVLVYRCWTLMATWTSMWIYDMTKPTGW